MTLTPEQIAEIATKAALAAVQAATGGAAASPKPAPELPDDREDEAEALATIEENERRLENANDLAAKLLPMMMQERHLIIFRWMAAAGGVSETELIRIILRNAVARETPNWREAQGLGGKTTKSAETMARLKGE